MSIDTYLPETVRDWHFGEIPITWPITTLKHSCHLSSMYGANIPADDYAQGGVRFIRTTDISEQGKLSREGVYIDEEDAKGYLLETNDFLISRSGTIGRAFVYDPSYGLCAYAGYLVRYLLKDNCSPQYLYYLTKSTPFSDWLKSVSIESTIGNVNGEKYANFCFPLPQMRVQHAIVKFLDRETTHIDTLIAEKEHMLSLLEEKRTALISQSVTRGLDPDVPLKPSDYLGSDDIPPEKYYRDTSLCNGANQDISRQDRNPLIPLYKDQPNHWSIKRLKWSTSGIYNGIWGDDPDGENDIVCVRVADFDRNSNSVISHPPTVRAVEEKDLENRKLESGDLLIEKSGGGNNQFVGCVVSFDHQFNATYSNFIARIPPATGIVSRYFVYVHAALYAAKFNFPAIKQTTGIQNLDSEAYFNIKIAFPTEQEQRSIANYLDRETIRIDALIKEISNSMELLNERRSALITAAVTGQIDPEEMVK